MHGFKNLWIAVQYKYDKYLGRIKFVRIVLILGIAAGAVGLWQPTLDPPKATLASLPAKITRPARKTVNLSIDEFNDTRNFTISYYTVVSLLIKLNEGLALEGYRCPAGVRTIGWGITQDELNELNKYYKFNRAIRLDDLTTVPICDSVFKLSVAMRYKRLYDTYLVNGKCQLDAPTLFALVSFEYNVGNLNGSSIQSGIEHLVKTGDKSKLEQAIKKYNKAEVDGKMVTLPGLVKRREWEVKLLLQDFSQKDYLELREKVVAKYNNKIASN